MTLPEVFQASDETPLARSPIVTVLWQLRFDDQPALVQPQNALRIRNMLSTDGEFALSMLPRVQLTAQVGRSQEGNQVSGVPVGASGGWRFSAPDDSWHVNVEPNSISVETANYGTWKNRFRGTLEQVVDAVAAISSPVIEMRLGLRYVNVVFGSALAQDPFESPTALQGTIEPELLGVLTNARLGEFAQIVQGRYMIAVSNMKAIVNHGIVTSETGELGYLLDIDSFRENARAYDRNDVIAATKSLHRVASGLFRASLTSEALDRMRDIKKSEDATST